MNRSTCPRRDKLLSFSLGKLPDDASGPIARHLDECPDCRAMIETLGDAGDTMAVSLRKTIQKNVFDQEQEWRQALAFIEEIGHSEISLEAPRRPPLATVRDYRLLEEIGHGGMGRVYKAEHARLKRIVALKLLPESRLKEAHAVARFAREMEAVGRLEHPNIVRAMDAGEHDGLHYLVMEFVPGLDLSRLVHRHGPLSVADACEIARQAAVGLQHAHEHGLIHRDVKPSNLMLTPAGQVKILDLGLALFGERLDAETTELTNAGQLMGTVDYMAPEQADDSHVVDIRADLYSLGATLYKLLCGEAPFDSKKYETPLRRIGALLTHDPQPIGQRRADLPAEVAAIVHRLLTRDPQDRFSTPAEVAAALAAWTAGADLPGLVERVSLGSPLTPAASTASTENLSRSVHSDTLPPAEPAPVKTPAADATTVSLPEAAKPQPRAAVRPRRVKFITVALALGLLGVLAAAGFAVRIATDRGELVIESAEPNLEVTVRRHDGRSQDLELKQGRNETTIRSGQYEVILTGAAADGLRIENDRFTLTRGGQAVVRITRDTKKAPAPLAEAQNLAEAPSQAPVAATNFSLAFDGNEDYVEIPSLNYDGSHPLTVEGFVTPYDDRFMGIVGNFRMNPWEGLTLSTWKGKYTFGLANGRSVSDLFSKGPPQIGRRVHFALVYDRQRQTLFIDGAAQQTAENVQFKPCADSLTIGHSLAPESVGGLAAYFFGEIDEIRISNVVRYAEDFAPQPRFEPDDQTVALYHFDEGHGDVLVDSSGNGHHGRIHGALWMESGGDPPWNAIDRTVDEAFFAQVAALPPDRQVQAIASRLAELNPGFDGRVEYKVEDGVVVELEFSADCITDLRPLRALPRLSRLYCPGERGPQTARLADLTPLRGLPLEELDCYWTRISDLSPLSGMKLKVLRCYGTLVSDLAPLSGMHLEVLDCGITPISDIRPLRGMRLEELVIPMTQVADLSPVEGMPLRHVQIASTSVASLSPLAGAPLEYLDCSQTRVVDLSPLRGSPLRSLRAENIPFGNLGPLERCPLNDVVLSPRLFHEPDLKLLRALPLTTVNGRPIADFMAELDGRRKRAEEFVATLSDLSPAEQVTAVLAKLDELYPGRRITLGHTIEEGTVRAAALPLQTLPPQPDLSPLRAFSELRRLQLTGGTATVDLSPLNSLPLEELTCDEALLPFNAPVLREMASLKTINGRPAAEVLGASGDSNPDSADRRIAEWVLGLPAPRSAHSRNYAIIRADGDPRHVYSIDKLPAGDFALIGIQVCEQDSVRDLLLDLRNLEQFSDLKLCWSRVSDDDLTLLSGLPRLTVLSLHGSRGFSDDALRRQLSRLSKLHVLQLNDTAITDKTVAALAALPSLTRVELHHTAVSDESVSTLSGLRGLQMLHLMGTTITRQGIETLRKALPGCRIDSDFAPPARADRLAELLGPPPVPGPGEPISPAALVSAPAVIEGVQSWTLETPQHRGRINVCALSPDGMRLLTGGDDATLRIWNVADRTLQAILLGHDCPIVSAEWSDDGTAIVSGGGNEVCVWDARHARLLKRVTTGDGPTARCGQTLAAWGTEETEVVTAIGAGRIEFRDLESGDVYRPLGSLGTFGNRQQPFAINRKAGLTAVALGKEPVRLWELATGGIRHEWEHGLEHCNAVAISPDGRRLAAAGAGGKVLLWDTTTGQPLLADSPLKFAGVVEGLEFAPDGKRLSARGYGPDSAHRSVHVWDIETGRPLPPFATPHEKLTAFCWSADGGLLVTAGEGSDEAICFWSGETGRPLGSIGGGLGRQLTGVDWRPGAPRLVVGFRGGDGAATSHQHGLSVWNFRAPKDEFVPFQPGAPNRGITWSGDGRSVIDSSLIIWNDRNRAASPLPLDEEAYHRDVWPWRRSWSRDGSWLALAVQRRAENRVVVQLRRMPGGDLVRTWDEFADVSGIDFSPDGKQLAVVWSDGTPENGASLSIFDVATGEIVLWRHIPRANACGRVAWSPDGGYIAVDDVWFVRLFDAKTGEHNGSPEHDAGDAGLLPDLTWLDERHLAGTKRGVVQIWNAALEGDVLHSLIDRPSTHDLSVSANRRYLATAAIHEARITIWDWQAGVKFLTLFVIPGEAMVPVAVAPAGHYRVLSDQPQPPLIAVVHTESGQAWMPLEGFARRHGWSNDPAQVPSPEE